MRAGRACVAEQDVVITIGVISPAHIVRHHLQTSDIPDLPRTHRVDNRAAIVTPTLSTGDTLQPFNTQSYGLPSLYDIIPFPPAVSRLSFIKPINIPSHHPARSFPHPKLHPQPFLERERKIPIFSIFSLKVRNHDHRPPPHQPRRAPRHALACKRLLRLHPRPHAAACAPSAARDAGLVRHWDVGAVCIPSLLPFFRSSFPSFLEAG